MERNKICRAFGANIPVFYPRPVLAFGYCRCQRLFVCPTVRVCGNHLLVRAITHHQFKLGSPNLDHRCKRPWLRSLLFWGVIDIDLRGQIQLQSQKLPDFELLGTITHHLFKLGSPNEGQRCKIPGLRFLLTLGLIGLDLQFHFQLWNPFFYQTYLCCFCKYLVRPSPVYIWWDHRWRLIGFHGYLLTYISFVADHRWTFRSIIDVAIDSFHIGRRIFSVNHSGARCLQPRVHRDPHACAIRYLMSWHPWDFKTSKHLGVPPKPQGRIWDCNLTNDI